MKGYDKTEQLIKNVHYSLRQNVSSNVMSMSMEQYE